MTIQDKFNSFADTPILVIGDIILDIYIYGKVDRISPEAPIPILNHQTTKHALGGAANVAANLKGIGADVTLISIAGEDTEAEYLQTMLDLEGINHSLIKFSSRPTTSKSRVIAANQQMLRIDHEVTTEISQDEEKRIYDLIQKNMELLGPQAIIFEDYNKGLLSDRLINNVMRSANENNIPVLVDPKKSNFFSYKNCTLFKPNFKECAAQVPFLLDYSLESLLKADSYLRSMLNYQILMITLAEHGIFISDGKEQLIIPTQIRQISDVSGAGDTVTAIATFGLLQSLSLSEIATLSNQSAGYVCGIPGVHAITLNELVQIIEN